MKYNIYKTIQTICKKNIVIIAMVVLLCPILAVSYSAFIFNTENYRASQMYIGNLLYSIRINGNSVNTLVVEPGETEAILEVTSLNTISSNYKVVYERNSNVNVIYAVDENEPTYGLITTTKTSSILVTNNSEENTTLTFNIAGGFTNNDVSTILVDNGYTEINNNYMKYDYETLALFIDNVRVNTLDPEKAYKLLSYTCSNNETVEWRNTSHKLSILNSNAQTKCQLYFSEIQWYVPEAYQCANVSNGVEPYLLTYTGNCVLENDEDRFEDWKISFLTSGTLTVREIYTIDAFLVGGGGGGAFRNENKYSTAGGGGGYTKTLWAIDLFPDTSYEIVVGAGGAALSSIGDGNPGEASTAFGETAAGGGAGGGLAGGAGGSGGGGGVGYAGERNSGANGGTNGSNGYKPNSNNLNGEGGLGQGTNTKEFGEYFGKLYSGGGGGDNGGVGGAGGGGSSDTNGLTNTGGGGGGSSVSNRGAGGSGIVIIRNHIDNRNSIIVDNINIGTFTGKFTTEEDESGNWKIKFLSSGIFISKITSNMDLFLVGGGGGGGWRNEARYSASGGGGGYTNTILNKTLVESATYNITVGLGGRALYYIGNGNPGEASTAFGEIANGGLPGTGGGAGGDGGSGGGGGVGYATSGLKGGDGGSDGNNGTKPSSNNVNGQGGIGQGTTTREFGEATGTLYSGGGGGDNGGIAGAGGGAGSDQDAAENTGGGGGGSSTTYKGAGGSGIVVIRIPASFFQ